MDLHNYLPPELNGKYSNQRLGTNLSNTVYSGGLGSISLLKIKVLLVAVERPAPNVKPIIPAPKSPISSGLVPVVVPKQLLSPYGRQNLYAILFPVTPPVHSSAPSSVAVLASGLKSE